MVFVMKAVADKKMTINAAATKFSVPRKTLDDHIKGRVQHGNTPGVDTLLTAEEEAGLWISIFFIWQVVVFPSPVPWSRHLPGP